MANPDPTQRPMQDVINELTARGKEPISASVLEKWVAKAQTDTQIEPGRLAHLIAATVVVAALQRAVDETGSSRFLLKGGTYLQYRLQATSRATKDVDGLVRGDMDEFLSAVDDSLQQDWGTLSLSRTQAETINAPTKVIKPRRFFLVLSLKGKTWRKVKVEIAADEAGAGAEHDTFTPPSLSHFGLPTPEQLIGLAMRFQIAQKIHASSDPHDPPVSINDRVRDVADLLLLRELVATDGLPSLPALREACVALFEARAAEAAATGYAPRSWPAQIVQHPHWVADYAAHARAYVLDLDLEDAIAQVNTWLREIDEAS